ncbi:NUDIX domain-containing protein [Sphingomonas gellani]|uniref:NUDIX domain-containing protein n=1 Tax=Sphingomonas gellani TaxID=1166340 RepID=A0A1H8EGW2_9SPHN|nr:NUDIX domain-containing protein [Sphingomonas gellani]SEN18364.1 NUDIX domain-containing protein [Sphingomonas gellani]
MTDQPIAIPAATLVIFRERDGRRPELLMLERSTAMRFAAGATVFPGGRIDAADHLFAQNIGCTDAEEGAARIAALRETLEETGVPIGLSPVPDLLTTALLRQRMLAGTPYEQVLDDAGLSIDLTGLTPLARWRPNLPSGRVFDTRFYLAVHPDGAPEGRVDGTENTRLFWANAADVLAQADAGAARLLFPTRRNLERLALFADHAAAVRDAGRHPVRTIKPFVRKMGGEDMLCIPEGIGYPITTEPLRSVVRG